MKEYDLVSIGTGSAMSIVEALVRDKPGVKVAVIDKDDPGGICLTRGCIPSKILLYPAELVRTVQMAEEFGVNAGVTGVDFIKVMKRMRSLVFKDVDMIREGLSHSEAIDYYHSSAEFIAPYTLKVGGETVTSKMVFLCTGSRPAVPPIEGLSAVGYHTSDTILGMEELPSSFAVIGGGYIAAEYGHFLSAMGSNVTVIGRNPQFLPAEEPEVSALAKSKLGKHMRILTNHEVRKVGKLPGGKKGVVSVNRANGEKVETQVDEILVAAGREPNTDMLRPERGGIKTDEKGWIQVDEYLQTSQADVWAFGDADGKFLFKHVANYEATVVYYNAILRRKTKVDYHAVPHAVFTYPEIASVGLTEGRAVEELGSGNVLIGMQRYEDTAKGEAMGAKDYFAKVIVERDTMRIVGAHIIGPYASILIQEIIDIMYTPEQTAVPILKAMHIHPAMSEVVERAFRSLMTPQEYHHLVEQHYGMAVS